MFNTSFLSVCRLLLFAPMMFQHRQQRGEIGHLNHAPDACRTLLRLHLNHFTFFYLNRKMDNITLSMSVPQGSNYRKKGNFWKRTFGIAHGLLHSHLHPSFHDLATITRHAFEKPLLHYLSALA